MNPMAQALERLQKQLTATLEMYDAFGQHKGEKGERRENAIAEVMEIFLPKKFRLASGEVFAASGQTSKQVDILIYDSLHSPVLVDARHTKIVAAESVYAAIEVKPNLRSTAHLHTALDNIRSVKSMPRNAILPSHGGHRLSRSDPACLPYGAIVTYGHHWPAQRIGDELTSYCAQWPPQEWPDQVCLCDDSVILFAYMEGKDVKICRPHWRKPQEFQKCLSRQGSRSFGFFLLELLYHIDQMDLFPPDLQTYLTACIDIETTSLG